MNLRTRTYICAAVVMVGLLILFVGGSHGALFVIAGTAVGFGGILLNVCWYRCPACGRYLGRNRGDYCPWCGEKIDYSAKS